MYRRLITGYLLFDVLCALVAPVAASSLADAPEESAYLKVDGMCVEVDRSTPDVVAWTAVPLALCAGS